MYAGILLTLALSASAWVGIDNSPRATPTRAIDRDARITQSVSAADSIEITNAHPHDMAVAILGEREETQLGIVPGGKKLKFAIVIPPGAKELRLRAGNPLNMSNMTVDGTVKIEPGKPLAWTIGVDGQ
jgi:hypothetical protein